MTVKIGALAAAATVAIGGGLAIQMASGADPALGPKAAAKSTTTTGSSPSTGTSSTSGSSSSGSSSTTVSPAAPAVDPGYSYGSTTSQVPSTTAVAPVTTRAS